MKKLFILILLLLANNCFAGKISDEINFVNLLRQDKFPDINSGDIDQVVDILDDLRFIGTAKIRTAVLTPLIKEGKILHDGKTERLVGNSGSGNLAISPEYEVDLTRLTKILKSLGYEFSINSGKVHIVASTLQGADINRVAFESGITLRLISDSASSLEEKFFELVQK